MSVPEHLTLSGSEADQICQNDSTSTVSSQKFIWLQVHQKKIAFYSIISIYSHSEEKPMWSEFCSN